MPNAPSPPAGPGFPKSFLEAVASPGGLLVTVGMLLIAVLVTNRIGNPDFWWQITNANTMLTTHHLIATNPYTYTVPGKHWVIAQWAAELLFGLLDHLMGLGGVELGMAVIIFAGFIVLLIRGRLRQPHYLALGGGLLLGALAGDPIWSPRAEMITFLFICLTMLILELAYRGHRRLVLLLVPLSVLWTNLHPGFITEPLIVGAFIAAAVLARFIGKDEQNTVPIRLLVLTEILIVAASILNPYGPSILLYPFQTQFSSAQEKYIVEWFSPNFHEIFIWPFAAMLLSFVVMTVANRKMTIRDALVSIGFIIMPLQSVRHVALFVAVVTPIWIEQASLLLRKIPALQEMDPAPPPAGSPAATGPGIPTVSVASSRDTTSTASARGHSPSELPRLAIPLSILVILATAAGVVAHAASTVSAGVDSLYYARQFPVCASSFLAELPPRLHVFNQYGEGGYLAMALHNRGDKVFIFGDAALMGNATLYEYEAITTDTPAWDQDLVSSGTNIILFDENTPLTTMLLASPDWVEVYHDPLNIAFVRRSDTALLHQALAAPPPQTPACISLRKHGLGKSA